MWSLRHHIVSWQHLATIGSSLFIISTPYTEWHNGTIRLAVDC